MKPDDFEQKLSRQPLRQIPAEWRGEILAAGAAGTPRCGVRQRSALSLPNWLSTLLWPHPKAWACLATVWIFIFILNFSTRDKTPVVVEKVLPPSPEVVAELRQQRLLFAQLIGSSDVREAEPPKFFPRPRTEFAEILTT